MTNVLREEVLTLQFLTFYLFTEDMVTNCVCFLQVRRGADRAEIYSLAFSNNLQYLAVSSDKGTIHVFNLKINVGSTANDKPMPAPDPEVPHISPPLSFIKGKFYPFERLVRIPNV